jgi:hypothetical protein
MDQVLTVNEILDAQDDAARKQADGIKKEIDKGKRRR